MSAAKEPAANDKVVFVYRSWMLHVSETFIKQQILALNKWRGILIGRRKLAELPLDGLEVRVPTTASSYQPFLWALSDVFGVSPAGRFVRQLRHDRASLVHAHFGFDAVIAWPLARALNLPMLVTLHGSDINIDPQWWAGGNEGKLVRRFYPRRLLKLASQPQVSFVAVSEAIRQRAIEYGIPADKIRVHYVGIDVSKFTPGPVPIAERDLRILFVGRLVEKKGCRYLIEAVAKLQKNLPDARLVVIGDGPLRQNLERFACEIGAKVDFRGARLQAEVKRELDAARLLCLPSVTAHNGDAEGFGLVLLEAQASGVPVVTSAKGGAVEGIREGITGFSFPEGAVDALAPLLDRLLTDSATLTTMSGAAARFVANEFNIQKCARSLEAEYDELTNAKIVAPESRTTSRWCQ